MNRLVVFGDSFTEGEGSNLELTHAIRDHYDNLKLGTKGAQICQQVNNDTGWPKVIAKLAKCPVENFGVSGYSNNKIMNSIFNFSKTNEWFSEDIAVVMWSSTIRDKLSFIPSDFSDHGPVGLGWSLKEIDHEYGQENALKRYKKENISTEESTFLDNILSPFMNEYYKKFLVNAYDEEYFNLLSFYYVYIAQEFFKYLVKTERLKGYIMIDAFELMTSFNSSKSKKWDLIDKNFYYGFGKKTAWDIVNELDLSDDVKFEDKNFSFNPPGQKMHPNTVGYKAIGEELYKFISKKVK